MRHQQLSEQHLDRRAFLKTASALMGTRILSSSAAAQVLRASESSAPFFNIWTQREWIRANSTYMPTLAGLSELQAYFPNSPTVASLVKCRRGRAHRHRHLQEGSKHSLFSLRARDRCVFRSNDKGETWTRMSDTNPRPMYFSQIRVDPNNDQRIWMAGVTLYYSEDGGKFSCPI